MGNSLFCNSGFRSEWDCFGRFDLQTDELRASSQSLAIVSSAGQHGLRLGIACIIYLRIGLWLCRSCKRYWGKSAASLRVRDALSGSSCMFVSPLRVILQSCNILQSITTFDEYQANSNL